MTGTASAANTASPLAFSWVGLAVVYVLGSLTWSFVAEMVRRSFGRRALWITTASVAITFGSYLLVRIRPRVAPDPSHPLAFLAVPMIAGAILLAPTYALDRGSRRQPVSFVRQLGLGTLAGVGFILAAFVITYLIALLVNSQARAA